MNSYEINSRSCEVVEYCSDCVGIEGRDGEVKAAGRVDEH